MLTQACACAHPRNQTRTPARALCHTEAHTDAQTHTRRHTNQANQSRVISAQDIETHTETHRNTQKHTHKHNQKHTQKHTHTHTHTHTTHAHTTTHNTHTRSRTHTRTRTHTHAHAHAHTRTQTRTRTHTHIHTHTHTHTRTHEHYLASMNTTTNTTCRHALAAHHKSRDTSQVRKAVPRAQVPRRMRAHNTTPPLSHSCCQTKINITTTGPAPRTHSDKTRTTHPHNTSFISHLSSHEANAIDRTLPPTREARDHHRAADRHDREHRAPRACRRKIQQNAPECKQRI